MTVRQEVLDKNPAIAQAMVDTWFDAMKYQQEHPQEALEIQAKQAGVSPKEFEQDRSVLKFLTPQEAALAFDPKDKTVSLYHNGTGIGEFLKKEKVIDKTPPDISSLIDSRFLQAYLAKNPAQ
jgi:ABC-type nitrate/sulfonate/bicarbonate transport system substrate-binding protein